MALELKQSFKDALTEENKKIISSLSKIFEELQFTSNLETLSFSKTIESDIFNSFLYEINCNITTVSGLPDLLISFKYGTQTSNITFDRFVICGQVLQEAKHNISKIVKDKFNTIFTVINTVEDMNKKIYSIGEIYETHNF